MTSYNGANTHNVESILASIRSTIGDDTDHRVVARPNFRPAQAAAQPVREAPVVDETSEFELPAIFKSAGMQPSLDARPNLFGRLSDALKPAPAPEPERSRTVIRFEPAAAGRMIEPPPAAPTSPRPAPQPVAPAPEPDPFARVSAENAGIRREMTSFCDSRMNRMSSMSSMAPSAPVMQPIAPPAAPQFRAEPPPAVAPFAAAPPPLPPVSDRADAQALGGGIEDAAAQMLRPILRQWLTENMPKIVEKALQIEQVGELPRGYPDMPLTPRKTLR